MRINYKKVIILLLFALLLVVPTSIYANEFSEQADRFFERVCQRHGSRLRSLLAFVCDLRVRVDELETQVANLEERVTELEGQDNSEPQAIIFAQDRPAPFNSDPMLIPEGFNSMTFNVSSTGNIVNWAPAVTFDGGATYRNQHRFRCDAAICPEVTVPIISNSYVFSLGTASGNITAIGTLNSESGAHVEVLGVGVPLPFTSSTFDTSGFSTIDVTVEQGNPQNLTGISLHRFEGGSFVEKEHLICDGGAECPLQSLPVIGGNYRVVIEGSGVDALVAMILRS